MDYSDQVSAFMNDYDEKKSAFYTAQSFNESEGKLQETAGGEIEGIGVGVGTVAYKAAAKLGLNDIADPIIKSGLQKGTSFLKDQANNLATKAKNWVQSKTSVNNETDATGNVQDPIGAVAAEVIPVVGLIGSVIAGIVELVKGHHEEKNNNNQFVMPTTQVDLPSYHPGIN
eukprot:gene5952-18217_t